jgi:hypothetical protein
MGTYTKDLQIVIMEQKANHNFILGRPTFMSAPYHLEVGKIIVSDYVCTVSLRSRKVNLLNVQRSLPILLMVRKVAEQ